MQDYGAIDRRVCELWSVFLYGSQRGNEPYLHSEKVTTNSRYREIL